MSQDKEWSYNYFCLTCKKYLPLDFFNAHKALGHSTERYISVPKTVKVDLGKMKNDNPVIIPAIKEEIRQDYADLTEEEPELEFEG